MSIASMAAALEEKKRRQYEEENNLNNKPKTIEDGPMSLSSLQEAAAQLDVLLATMPQTQPTQTAPAPLNPTAFWDPRHPVKQNMGKIQASLKAERVAKGLTQRELAVIANMSQGSITRAEKNGWISITTLLRIANALGKEITLN